ncbi:ABC transporter ATP-binding protein [Candidatus Saccharibacteria bacterium]|nr:ABC transporter ATP-binding protein [Candidatus Saccharibacteria bacterium]
MTTKKEIAISIENLHKTFRLPHEQHSGLKQMVIGALRRNRKKGYELHHVLKGLDFEIEAGDFFGIVGRNGSGKSTLLKTLAGIYSPDKGAVQVNGTLVPFIELGVGFNPELTGRENVFLNGALLGFSRDEMSAMYEDIVKFAELAKFMDQKLKNYSSGMQVRLAFSIAIRANADILLLDEVLAVGDESFQRKCFQYFAELKKNNKTVILVTHDMDAVQRFCDKAIMIEKGKIVASGRSSEVAQKYRELFAADSNIPQSTTKKQNRDGTIETDFIQAKINLRKTSEKLTFDITVRQKKPLKEDSIVALGLIRDTGEQVFRWASDEKTKDVLSFDPAHITLELQNIFPEGTYDILFVVKSRDRSEDYGTFTDILQFEIESRTDHPWDTYWKPQERFTIEPSKVGGR